MHSLASDDENLPVGHTMHWLLSADEYFPASHSEQVELPERATNPVRQLVQELLSSLGIEPEEQGKQEAALSVPEK